MSCTWSRQSCPSTAVATSNPSSCRFTAISCRITSSSSTTSTLPKPCVTLGEVTAFRGILPKVNLTERAPAARVSQPVPWTGSLSALLSPHSSGDRALASGARCEGSNPSGGTPILISRSSRRQESPDSSPGGVGAPVDVQGLAGDVARTVGSQEAGGFGYVCWLSCAAVVGGADQGRQPLLGEPSAEEARARDVA